MARRQKGQAKVEAKSQALERLEVEYVEVDSIKPNSYNPNRQNERDFQLLLRSMREDGFTQPVIVQRETREIVDGEHRWRAGKELGYAEIPVVFVDMAEAQMRLSTLRHNRARGTEDQDLTASLFRDLRDLGALEAAQDSLELDPKELDRILDDSPAPAALAGDDFGQAWEPMGKSYAKTERVVREVGGRPTLESATTAAMKELEDGEAKAIAATNEDDRYFALQKRDVFRIVYSYNSEEGAIVSAALGERPAERLVELCRARDVAPAE